MNPKEQQVKKEPPTKVVQCKKSEHGIWGHWFKSQPLSFWEAEEETHINWDWELDFHKNCLGDLEIDQERQILARIPTSGRVQQFCEINPLYAECLSSNLYVGAWCLKLPVAGALMLDVTRCTIRIFVVLKLLAQCSRQVCGTWERNNQQGFGSGRQGDAAASESVCRIAFVCDFTYEAC